MGSASTQCPNCAGSGGSVHVQQFHDIWYGKAPFRPQDRGSTPFLPTDAHALTIARHNCESALFFRDTSDLAIAREAARMCEFWNGAWQHHLNDADVAALIEDDRLWDFTHDFTSDGWGKKDTPVIPTALEVNLWSCHGAGHDDINCWVVIKARCKAEGELQ